MLVPWYGCHFFSVTVVCGFSPVSPPWLLRLSSLQGGMWIHRGACPAPSAVVSCLHLAFLSTDLNALSRRASE